ncbi:MAG: oxidoreductase [Bacteroidetes bacterium]|nr:oxidoreductase [Bacteroidota bacterium]
MDGRMKLATVWLGGCSGCHMSLLDIDERLFQLLEYADIVYSPFTDHTDVPEQIDILLVEGAAAQSEHIDQLRTLRARSRIVVAFGDCAVVGNVTAMRNGRNTKQLLLESFGSAGNDMGADPANHLPMLLDDVLPLHRVIQVDLFVPGCPPAADLIWYVLTELFAGRTPHLDREKLHYG